MILKPSLMHSLFESIEQHSLILKMAIISSNRDGVEMTAMRLVIKMRMSEKQ